MKLKTLIQTLEEIAPPEFAEHWDNTGLLIEPLTARDIQKVLLCIDLTEAVAREAIRKKADAIVAYHPLIFRGFQRLEKADPQARTIQRLVQHDIAVYSPHTALDAAPGGVNDWLADALGDGELYCVETGGARLVELAVPVQLPTLGKRLKEHLGIHQVHIAKANDRAVRTIALCAGSGSEALRGLTADCYLTGEMKHHDVLGAVEAGTSVILCGHTETERGYLCILRKRLIDSAEKPISIFISRADSAPLEVC